MVWTVARREVIDIAREGRLRWAAGLIAVLLLVSLAAGWTERRGIQLDHESADRLARAQWLNQPAKDPHSAAHYGAYAFKPQDPLSLFDPGVNAYTGVAAFLEAHKQNEFQFRAAQDGTSVVRFGELTAAATLQLLIPVLIVFIAFTRFAGEREDGTLRQVLASGVPRQTLAVGKVVGIALVLAIVLVPAAIVGAAAIILAAAGADLAPIGVRMAALSLVYVAYFVTILMISLTVSAAVSKSSHALALLIAFWVLNGVVGPRVASDVSTRLYPTPTAFEFAEAVERDTYDGLPVHAYNLRRAPDLRERLFREYQVARVQDLPVNFRGIDYLEREARSNQVWDEHYGRLWWLFERQVRTQQIAGLAAPLLALRSVSMSLSGSDFFHHRHFAVAAESYRRRLVGAMNRDLAFSATSKQLGYTADPGLWQRLAPFEYRRPTVTWAIAQQGWSLTSLAAWLLIGSLSLRYAVRGLQVE
jgi:ABC-2 type transport system permease protein